MALFKLSRTYQTPAVGANAQRGFPAPGAGDQTTGDYSPPPGFVPAMSAYPTQGAATWTDPTAPGSVQRGGPGPNQRAQGRPAGSRPSRAPMFGGVFMKHTPDMDRGASAFVPNFGKVLQDPIGGGIVALYRPQASYGPAAQYDNGALWWTSQVVPTSINLQGLTSPDVLASILGMTSVQAVVRTTG